MRAWNALTVMRKCRRHLKANETSQERNIFGMRRHTNVLADLSSEWWRWVAEEARGVSTALMSYKLH